MTETNGGASVRAYIERVVNQKDITAVDEMVSPHYRGSGHRWPKDLPALRGFYEHQYRYRPDWQIHIQQTIELADSVVARARAGGVVSVGEATERRAVEWLAHYKLDDGRITEINVLEVVDVRGATRSQP